MSRKRPRIDARARATGRLGTTRGERYCLLPLEVLESPAHLALPDWARTVLVALAARYNGANNGDLSLTYSEAKKLGVNGQWKLTAGLKLLAAAGLIRCTRRGKVENGLKTCGLYALEWRPIKASDKYDTPLGVDLPAPNSWATWKRPPDWKQQQKTIAQIARGTYAGRTRRPTTKSPRTTRVGDGRTTRVGATGSSIAPTVMVPEGVPIAPTVMVASENSPQGRPSSRSRSASSDPATSRAQRTGVRFVEFDVRAARERVANLHSQSPTLPPSELLRTCRVPPEHAAVVLEGIAPVDALATLNGDSSR